MVEGNVRLNNCQYGGTEEYESFQYRDAFKTFFARSGIFNPLLMSLIIKNLTEVKDIGSYQYLQSSIDADQEQQVHICPLTPHQIIDPCNHVLSSDVYSGVMRDLIEEKDRHINNLLVTFGYDSLTPYQMLYIVREFAWIRFSTSRSIENSISEVSKRMDVDPFVVRTVVRALTDGTDGYRFIHCSILEYLIAQHIVSTTNPEVLKEIAPISMGHHVSNYISETLLKRLIDDISCHDPVEYTIGPFIDAYESSIDADGVYSKVVLLYWIGNFMQAAIVSDDARSRMAGLWTKDYLENMSCNLLFNGCEFCASSSSEDIELSLSEKFIIDYILAGLQDEQSVHRWKCLINDLDEGDKSRSMRISMAFLMGDGIYRAARDQREIKGIVLNGVVRSIADLLSSSRESYVIRMMFMLKLLNSYLDSGYIVMEGKDEIIAYLSDDDFKERIEGYAEKYKLDFGWYDDLLSKLNGNNGVAVGSIKPNVQNS